MIRKQNKLNSVEFSKVFTEGSWVRSDFFTLKYLDMGFREMKCAATVSKKYTKTAILRNYKRRQIYNLLRNHLSKKNDTLHTGYGIILVLSKLGVGEGFGELEKDFDELMKKCKARM